VIALTVSVALGGVFGFLLWLDIIAGLVMGFVGASAAFLGSRRHRDVSIQVIAPVAAVVGMATAALVPLSLFPESGMTLSRHLAQYGRAYLPPVVGAVIGAILRFQVW